MNGISRRVLIANAAGGVLGVAGCGGGGSAPPISSGSSGSSGSSASAAALPAVTAWQPSSNDIDPQVKTRAVRLIEALGNWGQGQGGVGPARSRTSAQGLDPTLVAKAGPLEIRTAERHLNCKQRADVLGIETTVVSDHQRTALARQASALPAVRAQLATETTALDKLMSRYGPAANGS